MAKRPHKVVKLVMRVIDESQVSSDLVVVDLHDQQPLLRAQKNVMDGVGYCMSDLRKKQRKQNKKYGKQDCLKDF